MSQHVGKFLLSPAGAPLRELHVPRGTRLLSAREEGDRICIWALLEPDARRRQETRTVVVVSTDRDLPPVGDRAVHYLGTAMPNGADACHVFELGPEDLGFPSHLHDIGGGA